MLNNTKSTLLEGINIPLKTLLIEHVNELEKARIFWAERASAGPAASLAWLLLDSVALYKKVMFLIGRSGKYSTPTELADELSRRKESALQALGYLERCCLKSEAKEIIKNNQDYPRLAEALRFGRKHLRKHSFVERNSLSLICVSLGLSIALLSTVRPLSGLPIKAAEAVVRDSMKSPDSKNRCRFLLRLFNELRNGIDVQRAAIVATAQHIYFKHGDAPVSALFEALFQGKKRTAWSERISIKQAELAEVQLALTDKLKAYYATLAGTEAAGGRSLEELMSLAQAGDMSLMQHRFDKGPWISKERLTHAELMVKDLLVSRTHLEVVLDELLLSTSLATDLAAAAPALVSIVLMSGPLFRAIKYGLWLTYQGVAAISSLPSWLIAFLDSFLRRSSVLSPSISTSSATTYIPSSSSDDKFGFLVGPSFMLSKWLKSSIRSRHSLLISVDKSIGDIRRILTLAPSAHPFQLSDEEFTSSFLNNFEPLDSLKETALDSLKETALDSLKETVRNNNSLKETVSNNNEVSSSISTSSSIAFPDMSDRDIGLLSVAIDSTVSKLCTLYERGDIPFETLERVQLDLSNLILLPLPIDDRRRLASEIRL
jgi:hypothetical protein